MPNTPDQGSREEQIERVSRTIDRLLSELARTLRCSAVAGDDFGLAQLGALAGDALQSHDRLTVLHAEAQLIFAASELLVRFGDALGRGED